MFIIIILFNFAHFLHLFINLFTLIMVIIVAIILAIVIIKNYFLLIQYFILVNWVHKVFLKLATVSLCIVRD